MTDAQRLQLKLSELRVSINGFPEDGAAEDRDKLTKEYADVESRWRAAVVLEDREREQVETDPQRRELRARAGVGDYLAEAITGNRVTGAAAELRVAAMPGLDTPGMLPMELLLPRGQQEDRADVATTAPSDVGANQQSIVGRVFARSVAQFLGVTMPTVRAGDAVYPVLSSGQTAGVKAAGAIHEATAATFGVETATPKRVTARYLLRVEDMARFAMMEDALRGDLRGAISDKLDDIAVNGSGTAPEPSGLLAKLTDPSPLPTTVVTAAELIGAQAGSVDGKFAANLSETRQVMGVESFGKAASLAAWGNGSDGSAADYLAARSGGLRATARIAAPDATNKRQNAVVFLTGGIDRAVMPVWENVMLIRDPYTNAATGEVSITAITLMDFVITDASPWKQIVYKTAV